MRGARYFVSQVLLVSGSVLALVALLVLFYLTGILVPRALIGSGVDQFQGEERHLAEAVHRIAHADLFDGDNAEQLVASEIRVTSVEKCPGPEQMIPAGSEELHGTPSGPQPPFKGEVRLYTIFGIPYGTATVTCEAESGEL